MLACKVNGRNMALHYGPKTQYMLALELKELLSVLSENAESKEQPQ